MNKEEIIEFLRGNKPFIEQHVGVERIGLFGSYARGDACEESDIDFAVEMRDEQLFIDDINDSIRGGSRRLSSSRKNLKLLLPVIPAEAGIQCF